MRALPPILDPRPFRHAAVQDLFALALIADHRMRSVISHELDARAARRIARLDAQAEVIDALDARRRILNGTPGRRWNS